MIYQPKGVCSNAIDVEMEEGIIKSVKFTGGCNGNTQGISRLVVGMKAEDAIDRLKGIKCGFKSTSCPDQLACALEQMHERLGCYYGQKDCTDRRRHRRTCDA